MCFIKIKGQPLGFIYVTEAHPAFTVFFKALSFYYETKNKK